MTSLAIIDWGIGGFGFYSFFKKKYPQIPVTYFSDAGELPYGKLDRKRLLNRLKMQIGFFRSHGIFHIVIACNAMSTVLPYLEIPEINKKIFVTGVIDPALEAALSYDASSYGIVGGKRTIRSMAYSHPLRTRGKSVLQRIAQPLSARIEAGDIHSAGFESLLFSIMKPLRSVDVLILACTHYPAVSGRFQTIAPQAKIVDPARETLDWIEKNWTLPIGSGRDVFLTTGSVGIMKSSAMTAFNINVRRIDKIISLPIDIKESRKYIS